MSYLIILTFLLSPAYVIKFNLFGLPTNLLMVWIFVVWIIFVGYLTKQKRWKGFFNFLQALDKKLLLLIALFFISAVISLFILGFDRQKLGQFIVLFLQPISIFFIGRFIFEQNPKAKPLLLTACYLLLAVMGAYAIVQYFTLWGLPPAWWGNSVEPKRALSFFVHPNFYALFAAPLLAFLIPTLFSPPPLGEGLGVGVRWKWMVLWLLGAIGLLLSFSRAGWLGLAAAIFVYLIVGADKKIRKLILSAVIVIVIVIVAAPNLRWRLILPFRGEKSADSRIELWQGGLKAIKQSPITGLGLTGFATNYQTYITDKTLDTHNYPHNIFLDFWVETGLLGLVSFVELILYFIPRGLRKPSTSVVSSFMSSSTADKSANYKLALSLFLIALLTQGMIDNPYFKNDLAMVFWIILSLA